MSNAARPVVSIVAANCDAPDWIELFVKSIRLFSGGVPYELIIIDNGSLEENKAWMKAQSDIRLIEMPTIELYHGGAMDFGTTIAEGKFVCILDSDSHVQRPMWLVDLIRLYEFDPLTRLIGCVGPAHKPLHPPLFFFEKQFILDNNISWRYKPDPAVPTQTDTAQQAYWDVLNLGYKVHRLEKGPRLYQCDKHHDEIWLNGQPTIAHAWMGSRFQEHNPRRTKTVLDGITLAEHLSRKAAFFSERLVRFIMSEGTDNEQA